MRKQSASFRACMMGGAAAAVLTIYGGHAVAQERAAFNIPSQPLADALKQFGYQSGHDVLASPALAEAKVSRGVAGEQDIEVALNQVLEGSGLAWRRNGNTFLIVQEGSADPQGGSASDGAEGTVEALIVTAQKREEDIQDVPIAISAFSQEDLTRSQVAGGPDLMTQVPNFTFTKTNFSSYSIQIRGIGTQAISATVDPAVAVAFNNTPFIRNRFFEQEFYDLQRVEVLRGPQGTLYGRNATAGVVNIISAKPSFQYEARASADVGNFNSRRFEAMGNIPLVEDKVALRLAGAWTQRDGYSTNEITGNQIDGRDLWSTRLSLRFEPTDNIRANFIWEHFQEDDDRLRSGKQLCKKHVLTEIRGIPMPESGGFAGEAEGTYSQGCAPASMYSDEAFQTPNGFSLPYYAPLAQIWFPAARGDPYLNATQSKDLRVIESTVDPHYRARTDLAELQVEVDLSDQLTLTSETGYNADFIFSTQDYNRFATASGAFNNDLSNFPGGGRPGVLNNGVFCDPQVGCADRLVAVDLSTARSRQFSQELRLSSDFDGSFNFSLGGNFLRYDTEDKYYVFVNSLTLFAAIITPDPGGGKADLTKMPPYTPSVSTNEECLSRGMSPGNPFEVQGIENCIYIDPNPIGSLNDLGHNYFLSKNPYKLISYALFGEAYYNIADNLKVTGGLRWTVDKKEAPQIPSWLLGSDTVGYPVASVVDQEWREPTGRLTVDWKPDLGFTDETLLYASYAHGYKAGGANPPPTTVIMRGTGFSVNSDRILAESLSHPKTFEPEFVDAFEVGTKNTVLDGKMTFNLNAFYYDYEGYQISQIVNRSAVNLNFDAEVWGAELEVDWRPLENLRLGFKGGYENTRVADGSKAIDLMDRTAGNPDWVVARPFPSFPSNCILPTYLVAMNGMIQVPNGSGGYEGPCVFAYMAGVDPVTLAPYVPDPTVDRFGQPLNQFFYAGYPGFDPTTAPNNGEGFFKDLSGNELPNAPHFTATLTADYAVPLPNEWLLTLHTDFYRQSKAWTRIFNFDPYDRIKPYTTVNFAAIFMNEDAGWNVMAYVKNVFDETAITGAFLNSDDTGLTTNVFLTEPRLYGLRVTKVWSGGPLWGGPPHAPGEPYPFTLELGGGVSRYDGGNEVFAPDFLTSFSPALDPLGVQNRDLDTGDTREIRLTYRPVGNSWSISARGRFGRANGSHRRHGTELGDRGCYRGSVDDVCTQNGNVSPPIEVQNHSNATANGREEYAIADFMIGNDLGIGVFGVGGRSTIGFGLRYAEFKSQGAVSMEGVPDWDLPEENVKYVPAQHHHHKGELATDRSFEGVGPLLSWDAAARLWGDEESGHLDVDWSVTGAVLYGKQKAVAEGLITSSFYDQKYATLLPWDPIMTIPTPIEERRTESVTVPSASLSLGLSYEIQRIKVGAGYRWERYFDVIDGGIEEQKQYDRTIDGPYLKIAVGFGG